MDLRIESSWFPDFETMLDVSNNYEDFGEKSVTIEVWNKNHWNIVHLNVEETIKLRDFLDEVLK